jgi:hypothetical protein
VTPARLPNSRCDSPKRLRMVFNLAPKSKVLTPYISITQHA